MDQDTLMKGGTFSKPAIHQYLKGKQDSFDVVVMSARAVPAPHKLKDP